MRFVCLAQATSSPCWKARSSTSSRAFSTPNCAGNGIEALRTHDRPTSPPAAGCEDAQHRLGVRHRDFVFDLLEVANHYHRIVTAAEICGIRRCPLHVLRQSNLLIEYRQVLSCTVTADIETWGALELGQVKSVKQLSGRVHALPAKLCTGLRTTSQARASHGRLDSHQHASF